MDKKLTMSENPNFDCIHKIATLQTVNATTRVTYGFPVTIKIKYSGTSLIRIGLIKNLSNPQVWMQQKKG